MTRSVRVLAVVIVLALAGCTVAVPDDTTRTATPTATVSAGETPSSSLAFEPAERIRVRVVDVVDGDTIDVRLPDGSEDTVRLVGVDTPEVTAENDPAEFEGVPDTDAGRACLREAGHDASGYLESVVSGRNVTLLVDPNTDRRGGYGRLLAYVARDDTNVNYALVTTGHARVYDSAFALRSAFDTAEMRARDERRGLWRCQNP